MLPYYHFRLWNFHGFCSRCTIHYAVFLNINFPRMASPGSLSLTFSRSLTTHAYWGIVCHLCSLKSIGCNQKHNTRKYTHIMLLFLSHINCQCPLASEWNEPKKKKNATTQCLCYMYVVENWSADILSSKYMVCIWIVQSTIIKYVLSTTKIDRARIVHEHFHETDKIWTNMMQIRSKCHW